jgi:hypothetical protein
MIDIIFSGCVRLLENLAGFLGMTYTEINVWIFVIIWPLLTLGMAIVLFVQQIRIRRLSQNLDHQQYGSGEAGKR